MNLVVTLLQGHYRFTWSTYPALSVCVSEDKSTGSKQDLNNSFHFSETVTEYGGGCGGDGFGKDVQLNVITITMKLEAMTIGDFAKGEHVEDEKARTKPRPLGDTL